MQQLLSVWTGLDLRRRVILVVSTVAIFAAVLGLSRMAATPGLSLLYAGLDASAAGEVVQALEAQGVAHEVRGNGIYVDSGRRDELRMTLASSGLPATGGQGYELLDNLSGFGTTSQMFDAAYWRAKEGELARTILASPGIRMARVHIATPSSLPFRQKTMPTASVMVTTANGALSPQRAMAFKNLIASAVAGLPPENVSIIDSEGGIILGTPDAGSPSEERSEMLRANVTRLVEARVGPGNAVVELSLEAVTEREAIVERRVDPESRVLVSSDTIETSESESDTGGAGVTVASNLPDGDAANDGSSSQSQNAETREREVFEVSETTREIVRDPGAIKRITVAVLVNGLQQIDETGAPIWAPRAEEELSSLRELVASAVGFSEERGDEITIRSMQFEPIPIAGTEATPGMFANLAINTMSLIQLAVLALVALILGLFVVRPILSTKALPAPAPGLPPPSDGASERAQVLTGELDDGPLPSGPMATIGAVPSLPNEAAALNPPGPPAERLRKLIEERQSETVDVLRTWMEDKEEKV